MYYPLHINSYFEIRKKYMLHIFNLLYQYNKNIVKTYL